MDWFRKLFSGLRRDGVHGFAEPCCGEYETCRRACVPRGEYQGSRYADGALDVLHALYLETADYIERNKLGPVHHNQSMRMARDALAAAGRMIWRE